jgi:hypothetical protein
MKNSLVEIRKQAEQAVIGMSEGDIKTKAFETILKHLLSGAQFVQQTGTSQNRGASKSAAKSKGLANTAPKSCTERILFLKGEQFFKTQRSIAEIRAELKKNGWHYPVTSLSGPLQNLVRNRELRREYVDDADGRKGWKYSNP